MLYFLTLISDEKERDQLEQCYYKHCDMMFKVAFSILNSKEDTEDAIQEVFYKIAKNMKNLPVNETEQVKYLHVCVRNEAYTILNRKAGREKRKDDSTINEITDEELAEHIVATERPVTEAILSLPELYRQLMFLHYADGYSVKEIARMLKLKTETVKKRLARGKQKLNEILNDPELGDAE